jgi:hypothetical protein
VAERTGLTQERALGEVEGEVGRPLEAGLLGLLVVQRKEREAEGEHHDHREHRGHQR